MYTLIYHICVARTRFLIPLRSGRKFRVFFPIHKAAKIVRTSGIIVAVIAGKLRPTCLLLSPPFQESIVIIIRFLGIKTDKN